MPLCLYEGGVREHKGDIIRDPRGRVSCVSQAP